MMNKVGIYYAYWTRDWDTDFVPFVAKVKTLGFDILEVNAGTVTQMPEAERRRLREAAQREGIELTFCIGMSAEYDLASEDGTVRRRGIDFLQRQALMVREMDGKTLGGIIYGSWPGKLPSGADKRLFWDRSVGSMKEAVQAAEDCDVFLNVEVVNRFEHYLLNTAAEAVQYVEQVGSEHCRILLDSFHMNIEEDSFSQAIRTAGARLGHFHLGETNRKAPGRGKMDWDTIFGALGEIGYRGAVTLEPFVVPGGEIGRDICVFRDLSAGLDLDAEASRAARFVREKIADTAAG